MGSFIVVISTIATLVAYAVRWLVEHSEDESH